MTRTDELLEEILDELKDMNTNCGAVYSDDEEIPEEIIKKAKSIKKTHNKTVLRWKQ